MIVFLTGAGVNVGNCSADSSFSTRGAKSEYSASVRSVNSGCVRSTCVDTELLRAVPNAAEDKLNFSVDSPLLARTCRASRIGKACTQETNTNNDSIIDSGLFDNN